MRLALALAARGRYRTAPNPRVGAVVAAADGRVVACGWHRQVGGQHAEAVALARAGERARGGTLYVTLEPCAHFGRTPPCADAVVAAGVARVVACHGDPDPRVAGRGFARLRQAGIEVEVGRLAGEAARLNLPFLVGALERRPAVTLKWAMSLDGKIATAGGESQWISSPRGRRWALALREEHDATLVGSGTALADDPRLDRRLGLAGKPGLRVVLDRRLRLGAALRGAASAGGEGGAGGDHRGPERLFGAAGGLVIYTERTGQKQTEVAALTARGAAVVELPVVEPQAVLADLFARGVRSVLVEGGGEILASFVASELYDRVAVCGAPLLIGGRAAPGPLAGEGAAALAGAPRLERLRLARRGADAILEALRPGCIAGLLGRVLPG